MKVATHGGSIIRSGVCYQKEVQSGVKVATHGGRIIRSGDFMEDLNSGVELAIHRGSIIRSGYYYSWRNYIQKLRLLFMEEV